MKALKKVSGIIKIRDEDRENKKRFVSDIIDSSAPREDFYLMVTLSGLITAMGLIVDNIALVIAGMIVAPLLSPILAMGLGFVILNFKVFWRSLRIFLVAMLLIIIFSAMVSALFNVNCNEILLLRKMIISWETFSIALIVGITASYVWTRPNFKEYLSGVAVAVTIIPPLTSLGLILPSLNFSLFFDVLHFFLMNILGIFLGAVIVFSAMNFYKIKKVIIKEIVKEENNIKKESL
jgi:uncharacterized hydrophobic protein (TIGR00341 family)